MSRSRRGGAVSVSLFPFLSVLLCAMGVVIVIMSGQTLVALGSSHDQVVRITGDAEGRLPVYVECRAEEIELHPEGLVVPVVTLDRLASPYQQLLDELSTFRHERYLVLLLRPDGIETFEACLSKAESRGLDVGKDALLEGGRLIFEDGEVLQNVRGRRR